LPDIRSSICAGESFASPSDGLAALGNGTTTPAFTPGIAGPWKWAIVAGPERSE
jgi:hypothetical protein